MGRLRAIAPASMLTDVRGNNKKARPLFAWPREVVRAVVSWLKPTGGSVDRTLAGHVSKTHPSDRARLKLAFLLLSRSSVEASNGADNERPTCREAD
jgi:hypothetical protein